MKCMKSNMKFNFSQRKECGNNPFSYQDLYNRCVLCNRSQFAAFAAQSGVRACRVTGCRVPQRTHLCSGT